MNIINIEFSKLVLSTAFDHLFKIEERIRADFKKDVAESSARVGKGWPSAFFLAVYMDEQNPDAELYCCIGEKAENGYYIQAVKGILKTHEEGGLRIAMPEPDENPANFIFQEVGNA